MLATVHPLRPANFLARSTRARCPSWRAPIVGTSTTGLGKSRASCCIREADFTIRIVPFSIVLVVVLILRSLAVAVRVFSNKASRLTLPKSFSVGPKSRVRRDALLTSPQWRPASEVSKASRLTPELSEPSCLLGASSQRVRRTPYLLRRNGVLPLK